MAVGVNPCNLLAGGELLADQSHLEGRPLVTGLICLSQNTQAEQVPPPPLKLNVISDAIDFG